jgi:hypothetical protein
MAKPTAQNRLALTQAELEATNRQLAELEGKRNAALLKDDDQTAAKLLGEIERLQRLARGHRDKIKLLTAEAEREAVERRVKEKSALISRIERKLAERDQAGAELSDLVTKADGAFRRLIDIGTEIRTCWPLPDHDAVAAMLTPNTIVDALTHELWRIGARPMLLGGMKEMPQAGVHFPGGKPERLELGGLPGRIRPLTDKLATASQFASSVMREGRSSAGVVNGAPAAAAPVIGAPDMPVTTPAAAAPQPNGNPLDAAGAGFRERTPSEAQLGALLAEMAAAAEDVSPEGERRYVELQEQVVAAQDAINREKGLTS